MGAAELARRLAQVIADHGLSCLALMISGETGGFPTVFPKISGGRIWLPTDRPDRRRHPRLWMRELPADDPSYQETKECLEQVERGEWSVFQEGELNQAEIDRFRDAWKLPLPRRSEA